MKERELCCKGGREEGREGGREGGKEGGKEGGREGGGEEGEGGEGNIPGLVEGGEVQL